MSGLRRGVLVALAILAIGGIDSLTKSASESLLYGLVCLAAGYRLGTPAATWTVVCCILTHIVANLTEFRQVGHLPSLQLANEGVLLAVVAYGAHLQRLSHDQLVASRDQTSRTHQNLLVHLERAREVQCELLGSPPQGLTGLDLGLDFQVAVELGGDVFYVCPLDDESVFIFIGDVSGKGPKAALAATCVRALLDSIVRQLRLPDQVLAELQIRFLALLPDGFFVTAFCALVQPKEQSLTYSNAGHDPPLLLRPGPPASLEELPCHSMPVAVDGGERFGQTRLTFSPGDRLVVYTDGLIDARQGDGQRLGLEQIARLTRSFVGSSQALARSLLNLASEPLQDDVMILVIQCLAGSQGSPRKLRPGSKALCP